VSGKGPQVGLSIEAHRICAVEVANSLGKPKIVRSGEFTIPVSAGADANLVVEGIRQALATAGIRSHKVSVALSNLESIVRRFTMPLLPKREWPDAVRFEAQKYLPFDVRGLEFDMDISVDKQLRQMDVLFVGAKRESMLATLDMLRRAGVEGKIIEPIAFSFLRMLQLGDKRDDKEVVAYVDIDEQGGLTLVIARGSKLLMTREGLVNRISGASQSQAALDPESLLSEIRVSFEYLSKHFAQAKVQRLVFCGDLAAGTDQSLERGLGVLVQARNPIKTLGGSGTCTLGSVGAAGIALRGVRSESAKRFNLVPAAVSVATPEPQLSKEDVTRNLVLAGLIGLLLAGIGTAFSYWPLYGQLQSMRQQLDVTQRSQPTLQTQATPATLDEAQKLAANFSAEADLLGALIDERVPVTTKLSEFARIIPPGVWLTRLEYQDKRLKRGSGTSELRMEGSVYMEEGTDQVVVINRFASTLKENTAFMQGFDSMKIEGIRKTSINSLDISTFTLKAESMPQGSKEGS